MSILDILGYSEDEFGKINPDDVDKAMTAGDVIPEGKYHAMLVGACYKKATTGSEGYELEFCIMSGPFAGKTIKENLWKSDNAKMRQRRTLFAHRLGLLQKVGTDKNHRYEQIPGKSDWTDAINAQCVIVVEVEEYEIEKEGKKTGRKGHKNRLAWCGVFKIDDPDVKDVEKETGTNLPQPQVKTQAPVDDWSKLNI